MERFPETYGQLAPLTWEGASDSKGSIYGAALFAQSIYLTYPDFRNSAPKRS